MKSMSVMSTTHILGHVKRVTLNIGYLITSAGLLLTTAKAMDMMDTAVIV